MTTLTPDKLGRYEILAELGRGSMGAVFQARDPRIDRIVAIKTISVIGSNGPELEEYRKRFFREAQAAGKLSAPGIVTIHDVGEDEATQTPFIVMEYVAGQTLDQLVASACGRLSLEMSLDVLHQVAETLDYAHAQGIVHRDIKPANIIVTEEGRAKIADFGIAKLALTEFTVPGQVLGTPAYMSPEQLSGGVVDGRSDLFSLGVIAYWLLTGEKPFPGDTLTTVSFKVVFKDPIPATNLNPSLNPDFEYLLSRALAKAPEKRYRRGKELADDIQDLRLGRRPRSFSKSPPAEEKTMVSSGVEKAARLSPVTAAPPEKEPDNKKPWIAKIPGFERLPRQEYVLQAYEYASKLAAKTKSYVYSLVAKIGLYSDKLIARISPSLPQRLRRPAIMYCGLGVILLCFLFFLHHSSVVPAANLQVVGQHPFRSAEIFIWVDDSLRYQGQIRGAVHKHQRFFSTSYTVSGNFALTVPVPAGRHDIRVKVQALDEGYDQIKSIPGQFASNAERTLRVDFGGGSGMNLDWEQGPDG